MRPVSDFHFSPALETLLPTELISMRFMIPHGGALIHLLLSVQGKGGLPKSQKMSWLSPASTKALTTLLLIGN